MQIGNDYKRNSRSACALLTTMPNAGIKQTECKRAAQDIKIDIDTAYSAELAGNK